MKKPTTPADKTERLVPVGSGDLLGGGEIRFGPKPVWGIWNELGKCWLKAESGHDYKTDRHSIAAEVVGLLKAQGATGVEVKRY
jgi:hypothetical protein